MANYVHFERGKEFVTLADKDFYNTDEATHGILPTSLEIVERPSGGEGKCAKLVDLAAMPRTKSCRMSTMLIAIINGLIERLYFYLRPAKAAAGFIKSTDGKLVAWSSLSDDEFCKAFSLVPNFFSSGDFYDLLTACAPHDSVPHIMGELTKEQTRGYSYKWHALATLAFEAMREKLDAAPFRNFFASADATKPVITILPPTISLGYGRDRGYAQNVAEASGYFREFALTESDVTIDDLTGATTKFDEVLGETFCHLLPVNLFSVAGYADTNFDLANVLESVFGVSADLVRYRAFSLSASGYSYAEGQRPNYTGTGNPDIAKVWMVRNLATTGDAGDDGALAPLQALVDQALKVGNAHFGDVATINDWEATSEVTAAPVSLAFALTLLFTGEARGTPYCLMRMQDFALACNAVAIARLGRYLMFDLPGEFDSADGEQGAKRFSVPANVYHKKLRLAIQFVNQPSGGGIKEAIINGVGRDLFVLKVLSADSEPTSKTATANEMRWEYGETTEESTGSYNYNGYHWADLNPAAYQAQGEWNGYVMTSLFDRDEVYTLDFAGSKYNGIKVQSLFVLMPNVLKHSELFDVTNFIEGSSTGTDAMMVATVDAQFPIVEDSLFAARSDGLEMLAFNGASDDHRAPAYGEAAACVPSKTTFTADSLGSLPTVAIHSDFGGGIFTPSAFREKMQALVERIKSHGEERLFSASRIAMDAERKHEDFIFTEEAAKNRISNIIKRFGEIEAEFGRENVFDVVAGAAGAAFDPAALNSQYLGVFIVTEDFTATDGTTFAAGDILTCVVSDTADLSSGCFAIDSAAGTCELLGSPLPGSYTIKVNLSAATAFTIDTKTAIGKIMEAWNATTTFGHVIGKIRTHWRNLWISESKYA